jgi:hypothetical protein
MSILERSATSSPHQIDLDMPTKNPRRGPPCGAPTPTPVLITPYVQMTTTGSLPQALSPVPISADGWANFKASGRLIRLRLDLFGAAQLAQGNVEINATGSV